MCGSCGGKDRSFRLNERRRQGTRPSKQTVTVKVRIDVTVMPHGPIALHVCAGSAISITAKKVANSHSLKIHAAMGIGDSGLKFDMVESW